MPLLEQVLKLYPSDVKLVFKNFPLRKHTFAQPAALAALAAGKQDKFWEMHDKIFENYSKLSDEKIDELAQQVGLDMEKFKIDINDVLLKKQIQMDLQSGSGAGVKGTPSLFVNGRQVKQRNVAGFQRMIDTELRKLKGER